jgi:SAM-dependent methyltransferase
VTTDAAGRSLSLLADALITGEALTAAHRLGVLHRLDQGPVSAEQLATECPITGRGAPLLLDALVQLGLLSHHDDGRYHRTVPDLAELGGLLPALYGTLPEALAADRPDRGAQWYPVLTAALGRALAAPAAQAAAHLVAAGDRPPCAVLDVGAGAAPWSLAVARLLPRCRVTALDLPAVLPVTRAAVAAAGCADRYTFRDADVRDAGLPPGAYDLVLAANLCHLFDPHTAGVLLAGFARSLRPGGTLAVLNVLPDSVQHHPRAVALYALGLVTRTATGQLHPYAAYRGWLADAGLTGTGRTELTSHPPLTLITTTRPATEGARYRPICGFERQILEARPDLGAGPPSWGPFGSKIRRSLQDL